VARVGYEAEGVFDRFLAGLGAQAQRPGFNCGELVAAARREIRGIESAGNEAENPDVLAAGFIRVGGGHQLGVHGRHGFEIGESFDLVNWRGHGGAEEIHIVRKDDYEIHFRDIRRRADVGKKFFAILRDPFRLAGRESVGGKLILAGGVGSCVFWYCGGHVVAFGSELRW
jgi:hypothetical protein